jgi:Root hair defective 3 GTP-binding protein (RHD3)
MLVSGIISSPYSGPNRPGRVSGVCFGSGYYINILSVGTLLNRLFGTTFDVMDESKRQQTTKGEYSVELDLIIQSI